MKILQYSILIFLISNTPIHAGEIFKCKDDNGKLKFSDTKCTGSEKLISKSKYTFVPDSCLKVCDRKLSHCRALQKEDIYCRKSLAICELECTNPEKATIIKQELKRRRYETAKKALEYRESEQEEESNNSSGAINPMTGQFFPKSGNGVINPMTGQFYPKSGNGYIDTKTGRYLPTM